MKFTYNPHQKLDNDIELNNNSEVYLQSSLRAKQQYWNLLSILIKIENIVWTKHWQWNLLWI
jgi:hypothetical protein